MGHDPQETEGLDASGQGKAGSDATEGVGFGPTVGLHHLRRSFQDRPPPEASFDNNILELDLARVVRAWEHDRIMSCQTGILALARPAQR
jgi:hypothetical protein